MHSHCGQWFKCCNLRCAILYSMDATGEACLGRNCMESADVWAASLGSKSEFIMQGTISLYIRNTGQGHVIQPTSELNLPASLLQERFVTLKQAVQALRRCGALRCAAGQSHNERRCGQYHFMWPRSCCYFCTSTVLPLPM